MLIIDETSRGVEIGIPADKILAFHKCEAGTLVILLDGDTFILKSSFDED